MLLDGGFRGSVNFFKNIVQSFGDVPAGVVVTHFAQITNVANVVAGAVLIHVLPLHWLAAEVGYFFKGF